MYTARQSLIQVQNILLRFHDILTKSMTFLVATYVNDDYHKSYRHAVDAAGQQVHPSLVRGGPWGPQGLERELS